MSLTPPLATPLLTAVCPLATSYLDAAASNAGSAAAISAERRTANDTIEQLNKMATPYCLMLAIANRRG